MANIDFNESGVTVVQHRKSGDRREDGEEDDVTEEIDSNGRRKKFLRQMAYEHASQAVRGTSSN